jgi:hypothetical protein
VAAEAEHVGPGAQAEVFEVLAGAEGPGGADEAAGVVADVELGEFGGELQRPVEGARGGLGSLGGVFGDVGGDGPFGQLLAAVEVGGPDGADVELAAEGEAVGAAVDDRAVDADPGGGGADGVGEQFGGGPGRGRGVAAGGAVEADDGVEVDGAALLVLGDLGEGDAGVLAEAPLGQAGALGNLPAQVGREAAPELSGVRVPEDRRLVVVGVRVERGAEGVVVLAVRDAAAAGADRSGRAGGAVVDQAEAGGGEGGEDARMRGDPFGQALAAAQSGGDQVEGVAAVDLGAGRAAGGAAVVAADEEVAGGQVGRVEVLQDAADLAGGRVDGVLGAVAVEADRVSAAAEAGELPEDARQGAVGGQLDQFRQRGRGGTGEDGFSPSVCSGREREPGAAGCLAVSWPPRGVVGRAQRRWCSRSRERRTTAVTATEIAETATAASRAVRTTPPARTAATAPVLRETGGSERRAGVGTAGACVWAGGGVGLSGYFGRNITSLDSSTRLVM